MKMAMISCKQAALLGSKGSFNALNFIERIKLKMHVKICTTCQDYAEDSKLIDEAIEKILQQREKQQLSLTDEQKARILEVLK